MIAIFSSNWWSLALRGLMALIFGILTFIWPGFSLTALVFLFGADAVAFGVLLVALRLGLRKWGGRRIEILAGI